MRKNKRASVLTTSRPTPLARLLATAFGGTALALGAGLAQAQTQAQGGAQELQRVVVTGSNIPRADKETASPVQVLTSEDLKQSGYTSVSEVLRELTANGMGTLSQSFSGAFATGATGMWPRGLTVGATLVLIDGHRMAPFPRADDAQRPFVDISSIPFSAVDRIEVLKDGASAVYGSDAIAGVVNVILKKTIKGTQIGATAGNTSHGGGANSSVAIAHGFGTADDPQNGYVSLEYKRSNAIPLSMRSGDWTRLNWTAEGGQDRRPGSPQLATSTPAILIPYLQNGSATSAASFAFLNNDCNYTKMRNHECVFTDTTTNLQPPTENLNLIGRFNARLGSDWDMNITASYFDSKARQNATPQPIPAGSFAGVTAIGPGLVPAILNPIPVFRVPANYPGNTLGAAAIVRGFVPGIGSRQNDSDAKSTRLVAELNGTLGSWDFKGSAGYTKVEQHITYNGYIHYNNLYAALNDPVNPFPLNGTATAAQRAFVSPTIHNTLSDTLSFIDARITRELMQLEGGAMGISMGVGYFTKDLNAPDTLVVQQGFMNINGAYAVGKESNTNLFIELSAPVTKTLELSGALRVDHYDTYGTSTTPKIGFKFTPAKEFALRGTASQGFRAPSSTENGVAGLTFAFNSIRDPLLCSVSNANGTPNTTSPLNVPAFCAFGPTYLQSTTPGIQPEKSKSFTLGAIFEPVPGWSTTLDYYRIKIDNQIVSASAVTGFDPTNYIVRAAPQQVVFGDGRSGLSPVGTIAYIKTPYVNAQSTQTTGMEIDTRYKFKLPDAASLTAGVQVTHLFSYELALAGQAPIQLAGTHGPSAVGGETGSPKNRAQLNLTYVNGGLTLTSNTNYISSYEVTDPSTGLDTCLAGITQQGGSTGAGFAQNGTTPPSQYCKIPSLASNLTAAYKVTKGLTLTGGINNLFDKAPPVDMGTYGGTGTTPYNPSLHQIGAVGRSYRLGLDYTF